MEVETITMIELSLFITSIIGALVLFLKQLQQSKCNKINCLCFSCERTPEFNDNNDIEEVNTNTQEIIRP
jgi:hypothetical protein